MPAPRPCLRSLMLLSTWLLLTTLVPVASTAWAATTHCTAPERVLFTCPAGKKIVSVCASPTLTPTSGVMQYRFGPSGAPELLFPDTPAHPHTVVTAGTLMFSGGGGAYLRFTKGPYGYVVYSAIGKGWGEKAGVAVEQGGRVTANIKCTGPVTSELGPDLYGTAGFPEDTQGFALP